MASEVDEFDAFIASQPAPEDLDSTMGDRQESQAFNFVDDRSLLDASLPTGSPFAARADEDMTEIAGSERPFVNGSVLETVEEAQTEKEPTPVSRHLRSSGSSRLHSLNPRSSPTPVPQSSQLSETPRYNVFNPKPPSPARPSIPAETMTSPARSIKTPTPGLVPESFRRSEISRANSLNLQQPSRGAQPSRPAGTSSRLRQSTAPFETFSHPQGTAADSVKDEDEEDDDNIQGLYQSHEPHREQAQVSFNTTTEDEPVDDDESLFIQDDHTARPRSSPARSVESHRAVEDLTLQEAVLTIDSDDDIVEIDPAKAPAAVKRRWAEGRTHQRSSVPGPIPGLDEDGFAIKQEDEDTPAPYRRMTTPQLPGNQHAKAKPVNLSNIAAAQRAMLAKRAQGNRKGGPGKQNGTGGLSQHSEIGYGDGNEHPAKRRRDFVPDDPEQVEAAMRDAAEDHSWMNDNDEDDGENTDDELKAECDKLERRKKNGKITSGELAQLLRARKQLLLRDRLRAAAESGKLINFEISRSVNGDEDGEQDSLFISDKTLDREAIARRKSQDYNRRRGANSQSQAYDSDNDQDDNAAFQRMLSSYANDQDIDGPPTESQLEKEGNGKTRKPRKKPAKDAREVREREKERGKELKKKQKKKDRGEKVNRGRGRGKKVSPKTNGKKGGKGAKKGVKAPNGGESLLQGGRYNKLDGMDDVAQMILEDLMQNDPLEDRIHNPIFNVDPEEEIFGKQVKATQLQRLFSNIPGDQKKARGDKVRLKEASRSFGYAMVRAIDGKWLVKGMKSTLYHHQLLGAQWMVSRELNGTAPYGGLLADGMGLGKTVQTLACMVSNPPRKEDSARKAKATLIVVPSSVISQWLDEIRTHAEEAVFPKILHYKSSSKIPLNVIQDLDICVTSYQEVMKQFPFPDGKARAQISTQGYKKWWKTAEKGLGDLHKVHWYRVVLDEAHAIKNNSARTSLACQNLKGVYRWCLTGTPLLNRLEELFPYLRFLKANYSMDWKTFQRHFCDPDADDCQMRIATLLSYTMMRRTMKTTILNRPIITLPRPHPTVKYIDFSAEEKIIYRITETRFRQNLNKFFASGTASANYAVFLVQLLRLRQCTSHPFMLERTIRDSWTSEDVKELRVRLRKLDRKNKESGKGPDGQGEKFYEQVRAWVTGEGGDGRGSGEQIFDANMPFGVGKFGHEFKLDEALKSLSEKDMFKRVVCGVCSDIPHDPQQTDCGHIFCHDCIDSYMHSRAAESEDDYYACPSCDRFFTDYIAYAGPRLDIEDDDMDSPSDSFSQSSRGRKSKKGKGKDKDTDGGSRPGMDQLGFEPKTEGSSWVTMSDNGAFPLAPSAKTATLKAILLQGFEEAPFDKVVIYVQFRLLARIVGRLCSSEGWGFLYLTGDSSLEHRTKAISQFRTDPDVKILIAGLKCGGLGLNFPWANRCISLDLWWNHAVEQQAFGRIFRIGQMKETFMTRIVVRNSVDMRLLTMQMYKLHNCERVMESGSRGASRLELHDLAQLFGFLRTDEDDHIISIEPDYDDLDGAAAGTWDSLGQDDEVDGDGDDHVNGTANGGGRTRGRVVEVESVDEDEDENGGGDGDGEVLMSGGLGD